VVLCAFIAWTAMAGTVTREEVLRATLNNGLRVVIVRNSLAPVVATEVNYLVGSNEAPPGKPSMPRSRSLRHHTLPSFVSRSPCQTSSFMLTFSCLNTR